MAKLVKNKKELEKAMDDLLKQGIEELSVYIDNLIHEFLEMWYDDYDPMVDTRTYQLLKACTIGKIERI